MSRKVLTEVDARVQARQLEKHLGSAVVLPGRSNAPATVGGLIDR